MAFELSGLRATIEPALKPETIEEVHVATLTRLYRAALMALVVPTVVLAGCSGQEPEGTTDSAYQAANGENEVNEAADRLVAIDVLLEPDQTMLSAAGEWNARLREQMPEGFTLDATHRPHITLVQQYVREQDLGAVVDAVEALAGSLNLDALKMTANGLYHIPSGEMGLQGITIAPTPAILELQAKVIQALAPYRRSGGDQSAFAPDPDGVAFDPYLFEYVDTFAQSQTGENYNPHVTTGTAPLAWLEAREKEPFQEFQFGVSNLTIYKLGNFGTAAVPLADK
ncbi:hypothetical protein GRI89_09290 [Altererythrobacter salegens]|uniref:2'-5' RNA ligase superfamily protein n=1 Tax=Croceibacterium salegens TaxID=1737568 RepID=A0A6I4SZL2_9SPHN|nr:2'-5' RNA ligase family protein [Croceibacterium salegens]MXO59732.1 hypothetical protein [Croceibacterium salegens]